MSKKIKSKTPIFRHTFDNDLQFTDNQVRFLNVND